MWQAWLDEDLHTFSCQPIALLPSSLCLLPSLLAFYQIHPCSCLCLDHSRYASMGPYTVEVYQRHQQFVMGYARGDEGQDQQL